jgi:hypothetical protein
VLLYSFFNDYKFGITIGLLMCDNFSREREKAAFRVPIRDEFDLEVPPLGMNLKWYCTLFIYRIFTGNDPS